MPSPFTSMMEGTRDSRRSIFQRPSTRRREQDQIRQNEIARALAVQREEAERLEAVKEAEYQDRLRRERERRLREAEEHKRKAEEWAEIEARRRAAEHAEEVAAAQAKAALAAEIANTRNEERVRNQRMQVTSPASLRALRDLIKARYQLDMYIWSKRRTRGANRDLIEEKMEKADAILAEINSRVDTWSQDERDWTPEEWNLAQSIKERIKASGKREWSGNPPWNH